MVTRYFLSRTGHNWYTRQLAKVVPSHSCHQKLKQERGVQETSQSCTSGCSLKDASTPPSSTEPAISNNSDLLELRFSLLALPNHQVQVQRNHHQYMYVDVICYADGGNGETVLRCIIWGRGKQQSLGTTFWNLWVNKIKKPLQSNASYCQYFQAVKEDRIVNGIDCSERFRKIKKRGHTSPVMSVYAKADLPSLTL